MAGPPEVLSRSKAGALARLATSNVVREDEVIGDPDVATSADQASAGLYRPTCHMHPAADDSPFQIAVIAGTNIQAAGHRARDYAVAFGCRQNAKARDRQHQSYRRYHYERQR